MEHNDKKLKLDLDFLGEGAPEKLDIEKKRESKEHKPEHKNPEDGIPMSDATKWILSAIGVAVLIISIAAFSSGGSGSTVSTKTLNQQCKDDYGVNSYFTGEKSANGGPVCGCNDGYQWNVSKTACVAVPKVKTGLEICRERNGVFATYDSTNNSCGCVSGYSLGDISQQCVSYTVARDEKCAAHFPGTSFLKVNPVNGEDVCDCVAGSYWNNEGTACLSLSSFNQSCVNTFGTGTYSTTENGKRICDCRYGYDWNIERNACVTTASINATCERDVGRNSRYAGYVKGGKYICTEPY